MLSSSSFFSTTLNLLMLMLKLKTPPASNRECAKVRIKTNQSICFSIDFKYFFKKLKSFTWIIYVGLIVTGGNAMDRRKNVEVFPEKLDCALPPQLPDPGELSPRQVPCLTFFWKWAWGRNIFQGRYRHSLSVINDSLVVCGGKGTEKSCISWKQGQTSWEDFHTLRSVCSNYSNAIHMSNQEPSIVGLKPLFLLGLQLGRAIPYLIFVTGATGGARVNFLAGVNFYRFNAKNWQFTV